jgi:hypothetical protein
MFMCGQKSCKTCCGKKRTAHQGENQDDNAKQVSTKDGFLPIITKTLTFVLAGFVENYVLPPLTSKETNAILNAASKLPLLNLPAQQASRLMTLLLQQQSFRLVFLAIERLDLIKEKFDTNKLSSVLTSLIISLDELLGNVHTSMVPYSVLCEITNKTNTNTTNTTFDSENVTSHNPKEVIEACGLDASTLAPLVIGCAVAVNAFCYYNLFKGVTPGVVKNDDPKWHSAAALVAGAIVAGLSYNLLPSSQMAMLALTIASTNIGIVGDMRHAILIMGSGLMMMALLSGVLESPSSFSATTIPYRPVGKFSWPEIGIQEVMCSFSLVCIEPLNRFMNSSRRDRLLKLKAFTTLALAGVAMYFGDVLLEKLDPPVVPHDHNSNDTNHTGNITNGTIGQQFGLTPAYQ